MILHCTSTKPNTILLKNTSNDKLWIKKPSLLNYFQGITKDHPYQRPLMNKKAHCSDWNTDTHSLSSYTSEARQDKEEKKSSTGVSTGVKMEFDESVSKTGFQHYGIKEASTQTNFLWKSSHSEDFKPLINKTLKQDTRGHRMELD